MAAQQQQPSPTLNLPPGLSPDQLDITTELNSVLSRLRAPVTLPGISSSTASQTPANTAATPSSQQQQQQSNNTTGDISLRDFPAATDHLRLKLQEARAAVLALPDMDKSVADQEREIAELEACMRRQREQLEALKEKGHMFATTDRMMAE